MDQQRPADTKNLEHARYDEHLQEEADEADGAEIAAVRLTDELLPRRLALDAGTVHRFRGADDIAAEQVLARRVYHVEEEDERPDEQQIAIGQHHLEGARTSDHLLFGVARS